jgi:hypothetical protein
MPKIPAPKKGNPTPLMAKPVAHKPSTPIAGPAIPIPPPKVGPGGLGKGGPRVSVKKKAF